VVSLEKMARSVASPLITADELEVKVKSMPGAGRLSPKPGYNSGLTPSMNWSRRILNGPDLDMYHLYAAAPRMPRLLEVRSPAMFDFKHAFDNILDLHLLPRKQLKS
jgi:hypothetical protein